MFTQFPAYIGHAKRNSQRSASSFGGSEDDQPLAKRRRITSDEDADGDADADADADGDDDSGDEDKPLALAARAQKSAPRRAGGKTSGMSMKAKGHLGHTGHTGPAMVPPPTGEVQAIMNGEITPVDGRPKTTMEEQMSDKQLDRLAGGVTVDTGSAEAMAVRTFMQRAGAMLRYYLANRKTREAVYAGTTYRRDQDHPCRKRRRTVVTHPSGQP